MVMEITPEMNEVDKRWLTKYMWRGDETSLPVKADHLKAASEYTLELEKRIKAQNEYIEHLEENGGRCEFQPDEPDTNSGPCALCYPDGGHGRYVMCEYDE